MEEVIHGKVLILVQDNLKVNNDDDLDNIIDDVEDKVLFIQDNSKKVHIWYQDNINYDVYNINHNSKNFISIDLLDVVQEGVLLVFHNVGMVVLEENDLYQIEEKDIKDSVDHNTFGDNEGSNLDYNQDV